MRMLKHGKISYFSRFVKDFLKKTKKVLDIKDYMCYNGVTLLGEKYIGKMKSAFTSFKNAYASINKQAANSFAVPFIVSFVVFVLTTIISLIITEELNDISQALPVFCSSLFSTVITFCSTTTIQNFFEIKYTDRDIKDRSSRYNISSGIYSLAYIFIYFIYLLKTSLGFGITFLVLSAVAIILSLLAFVETYQTDNNSISG